jgi:hypothetical protein
VGAAGQVRPRRNDSDEEAHRTPLGKRASWSGNQLIFILNTNKIYENSLYKKLIYKKGVLNGKIQNYFI